MAMTAELNFERTVGIVPVWMLQTGEEFEEEDEEECRLETTAGDEGGKMEGVGSIIWCLAAQACMAKEVITDS